ncbi:hypothetical protein CFAM422_006944 [Trichoderma lentiforme]|uniref:Uncharacterized protein n=1 Tax=Trichoderma lentiforme TaxID=1567552 RepID=A0A9P4XF73_9HYPO|nr:hypothetical protein CFAM422_006944 [Trichoderma lentiforme]
MPYEKTVTRTDEDAAGQRNLGVVKVGHEATGMPLWKVIEAGQRKPEGDNRTQVHRGGQGHSKRNASREGNLSVGSNQNGSAYEKLARMDEGLRVEADGLDDDGDDTDSDESRSLPPSEPPSEPPSCICVKNTKNEERSCGGSVGPDFRCSGDVCVPSRKVRQRIRPYNKYIQKEEPIYVLWDV